jgi:hypothetical protein
MKNLFDLFFKKYKYVQASFHMGTDGVRKHDEFINYINEHKIEIINSYVTYNRQDIHSHKPEHINYLIKIKI